MEYAAVISLEDLREAKSQAELRQKLHELFDQWLDKMEEAMKEPQPTLAQLTEVVFNLRQELTRSVAEGLVESRYAAEREREVTSCQGCGRPLRARETVERMVETMVGAIRLSRPYFYCVTCHRGIYPLDEALELAERRKQHDVQKAAAKLTKEVPLDQVQGRLYETACEPFEELTGLPLSAHTAQEITNEVAEGLSVLEVTPSREEVEAKIA